MLRQTIRPLREACGDILNDPDPDPDPDQDPDEDAGDEDGGDEEHDQCIPTQEICDDGIDNDCDGLIDTNDMADCQSCFPFEMVCDNGIDEDCDGLIDTEDSDCPSECIPSAEICDDGIDNDCDGLIDSSDFSDCPVCASEELSCDNGIDEDCDGLIDGADDDCQCISHEICGDGIDNDCNGWIDDYPLIEFCGDGIDNDCNGAIDEGCDCLPIEAYCEDGVDNDCDGLVDGEDEIDCPPCEPTGEEFCDGTDNDCDGLVDETCVVDPEMLFNDYCAAVAAWPAAWIEKEDEALELINQVRQQGYHCGSEGYFPPTGTLTNNSRLRCMARNHSLDMHLNDFVGHCNQIPGQFCGQYGGISQRLIWAEYDYQSYTENVAGGYSEAQNVVHGWPNEQPPFPGWMQSDGHCRNIMRSDFTEVGIGFLPQVLPGAAPFSGNVWTYNPGRPAN